MKCKSPFPLQKSLSVKDAKSLGNKYEVFVPCGKCLYCRMQRRREWALRLMHENEYHESSVFVTLTYQDNYLPEGSTLVKRDLQDFFRKVRRRGKKFKYYACGEYGRDDKTSRPHYHAIMFGENLRTQIKSEEYYYSQKINTIEDWPQGNVVLGDVTHDSIRYTAQYIDKKFYGDTEALEHHYGKRIREFQLQSQGLGLRYLQDNKERIQRDGELSYKGKPCRLPRYYEKKLLAQMSIADREAYQKTKRKKAQIKNSDLVLEVLGYGGTEYHNLDITEKEIMQRHLNEQGEATQAHLKAQAKLYSLQKEKI